ncbi:MAG TPA: M20/M25/M40 family metallo-hydrolase [Gemmatimonadales bacterium]|nr:M20/M25/M40 family metallo-hydrolase [Gemmatimonadales bacterium]
MPLRRPLILLALALALHPPAAVSQSFPTADTVIRRIWREGMERSEAERLAQVLMDSIGPRLSGSPGFQAAGDWLVRTYERWGVTARQERYGTWRGWQPGPTHVDLTAPRAQTLEARLLAWSPGTKGPVEGPVVAPPEDPSPGEVERWLSGVRGAWVLLSPPEPTCRAPQELEKYARPETVERISALRERLEESWRRRLVALGGRGLVEGLERAGAAGVLTSEWSRGWGVNKVFDAPTRTIPALDVSCEDYGLLVRLAERRQGPRVRVTADAADLGTVPMFNVIARIEGVERPGEFVVLSAHLDSWHGATGATDNGTGTISMLEAMRILRAAYPRPRRTILVGHWGGEEQGLNGSGAFAADHPEVVAGLQALFNQDNGTWRAEYLEAQGLARAGEHLARWVSLVPAEIAGHLKLDAPGPQSNGGSDHSSFLCRGAPAFRLQSSYSEYRQYTWHTNRDTFDKIVFDDLRNNATLAAMLAYAASEDPERVPRDRAALPPDSRTGQPRSWMRCGMPERSADRE